MKKTILITIYSFIFFLLALSLNAQVNQNNIDLKNKIDQYLSEGVKNGFSGSVLVAKEGQIILNKGYGMANRENKIPYTQNTVATIGSVTKQFTATAILKLVELNKLKVSDPLSNFFKNIPEDKKNISIHQLLTHSSGLIDVIGDGDFNDIPRKRFFKALFATELLHQPGSKYAYSNAGYSILARVIELVSNQDYEDFLNEYLFKPAGMNQTGYFITNWDENLFAKGYANNVVSVGTMIERYRKMGKVTWTLKGNGGIHSTPGDMYKWYQALKANTILSKSMFEKLTTPYILEYEGGTSNYAYGWVIYNSKRNTKIITHNGGNGIYFHDFIWMPKEDVLIILFTNAGCREVEAAWPIRKMIFEKDHHPKPIQKSLHLLVIDFMKNNDIQQSKELKSIITKEYDYATKDSHYLNGLGYDLMRYEEVDVKNNISWAIEIFKLNTELHPENGNIWDSLGEGYLKNGQEKEAIRSYKKALKLAPEKDCSWCKSSTKALSKLQD